MTCRFCGSESMVVRRLRRMEPPLPDGPPPKPPIDPSKDYGSWGCEALVWGILNGTDVAEQIKMAKELDAWPHTHCKAMPGLLTQYVAYMLTAPAELDKAMCGILGKLICGDDLKLRNLTIRVGQKYGFTKPGSKGLLFALSLGDAGTVKLLLEIAEWANEHGDPDCCKEALIGVRTAIGRERDYRHVCNEILLHRLPYTTGQVRDWLLQHIRLEFDVGYRQHRHWVLQLIDDMVSEQPELIEPLNHCLAKCGSAQTPDDFRARVYAVASLRTKEARLSALISIGRPHHETPPEATQELLDQLKPLLDQPEFSEPVARILKELLWLGEGVPDPLQALWDERGDALPRVFIQGYKSRAGIRD